MDDLLPTTWLAYKQITQIRDPLPQTGYTERFQKGKKTTVNTYLQQQ